MQLQQLSTDTLPDTSTDTLAKVSVNRPAGADTFVWNVRTHHAGTRVYARAHTYIPSYVPSEMLCIKSTEGGGAGFGSPVAEGGGRREPLPDPPGRVVRTGLTGRCKQLGQQRRFKSVVTE